MTKHKIYIQVVKQVQKELMITLYNCQATFEMNTPKNTFYILDVVMFNFDHEHGDGMYRIQIQTNNNTKDIFIAKENMLEFTVHF